MHTAAGPRHPVGRGVVACPSSRGNLDDAVLPAPPVAAHVDADPCPLPAHGTTDEPAHRTPLPGGSR